MNNTDTLINKYIKGVFSEKELEKFELQLESDVHFRAEVLAELALIKYLPEKITATTEVASTSALKLLQAKISGWKKSLNNRFDALPYLENLIQNQLQWRTETNGAIAVESPKNNETVTNNLIFELTKASNIVINIAIVNNQSEPMLSDLIIEQGQTKATVNIEDWLPGKYYLIANVEGQPDFVTSFYVGEQES